MPSFVVPIPRCYSCGCVWHARAACEDCDCETSCFNPSPADYLTRADTEAGGKGDG